MEKITIKHLDNTEENKKIISELILKDVSNKCFSNKDTDGNLIPINELADLYLEYTDMFSINYYDKIIGLFSLTNGNEISIFIEPDYQQKGLGKIAHGLFEKILKEDYKLTSLVAEIVPDNIGSIKILEEYGFKPTGELREVPINNVYVKVITYSKKMKNE